MKFDAKWPKIIQNLIRKPSKILQFVPFRSIFVETLAKFEFSARIFQKQRTYLEKRFIVKNKQTNKTKQSNNKTKAKQRNKAKIKH